MHMREKKPKLSEKVSGLIKESIYFYSLPCGLPNNYNVNAKCLILLYIGNILTCSKSATWKTQLVLPLARSLFMSYFLMYLFLYGNYHYPLHWHYKILCFKLETLL